MRWMVSALLAAAFNVAAAPQMKCNVDEFSQDRSCEPLIISNAEKLNGVSLSTTQSVDAKKNDARLYISWAYSGSDWIFANEVKFLVDGTPIPAIPLKFNRRTVAGMALETNTENCNANCISLIEKIARAKVVKFRISGEHGNKDALLSSNVKHGLLQTIEYYRSIKK